MYYNFDRVNSYNCIYNFILTNRGFGKSYGAKKRAIDRFLKYGEQFMYVRRYKSELKKIRKYFEDIQHEYPNVEFSVSGSYFYINKKVCGYAVPLSTSLIEKSVAYPLVDTIIFDEFIIPEGYLKYLPNEVETMLDLTSTVVRDREKLRVYFLANNISEVNPYFIYFNIKLPSDDCIKSFNDNTICVHKTTSEAFVKKMEDTPFGRLIKGTKYADYNIHNKSLCDSDTFIEKMSLKGATPLCKISHNGQQIQVWYYHKENIYYCNKKLVENTQEFVFDSQSHGVSSIMSVKKLKMAVFDEIVYNFQLGLLRFESQEVKHLMYKIFKMLGIR